MKICIDLRSPGYAGVLNYVTCLLRSLLKLDKENNYIILVDRKGVWEGYGVKQEVIPSNTPLGWMIWSNTILPKFLQEENVDVYHSSKHITAFRKKTKKIITFHSARFFLMPEHYKLHDYIYWRIMYPAAAKRYDRVITVSEAERENYLRYISVSEKKFKVIHLAAHERFKIIEDHNKLEETRRKFNLPDQFILFVGRLLPVKNIEGIIRAYHVIKKQRTLDHKLVIVGKESWYSKKIHSLVRELSLTEDIIFTGAIFDELPCVYNLADLFVFPSYYEAFGAVPLEAMACGRPVVASRSGGIPEVVGDAAILVSPTDVNELADAIGQVLSSGSLRASMIQKGLQRTQLFSWERCAAEHRQIYEELAQA